MRLKSISIQNHPPIERFEVEDLSNLVVIAGPNGMGKSRLLDAIAQRIRAPNADDQNTKLKIECDGQSYELPFALATRKEPPAADFINIAQQQHPRKAIRDSLLVFESSRSRGFDSIRPYQFSVHASDPRDETTNSNRTGLKDRIQEIVTSILRLVNLSDIQMLKEVKKHQAQRPNAMVVNFPDPIDPFRQVFAQLFGPKEMLKEPDIESQTIFFGFQGQTFPLEALSSGEKEVLAIVFDFVLRNPQDCIILFDEPELHLHPELTLRMVEVLRGLPGRNQFIFCTHSAPLISLGLQHQLIFLRPPKDGQNQALVVKPEDTAPLQLLGQELGVFSLGKKMVLIEGSETSLDYQTYRAIIHDTHTELALIPARGRKIIENFHLLQEQVLGRSVWGTEFFMLCDRDTASSEDVERCEQKHPGRLKFLPRYHLENYFLDENILAQVCVELDGNKTLRSPTAVQQKLIELARARLAYAASLYVAAEVRDNIDRYDIQAQSGNLTVAQLCKAIAADGEKALEHSRQTLNADWLIKRTTHWYETLQKSIDDGQEWKKLIPGKNILQQFIGDANVRNKALINRYITCAKTARNDPFAEIREIFASFDRGAPAAPAD